MMYTRAEIIEKIQKLQALADNAAALPGEKQAALSRIKSLRAKHNIPDTRINNQQRQTPNQQRQQQQQQNSRPQYKTDTTNYTFNWQYTKEKVNMSTTSTGKIRLDFSDTPCTEKQFNFIVLICNFYTKINKPLRSNVTYESACDFLANWAPKYQRRWRPEQDQKQQTRNTSSSNQRSDEDFFSKYQDIFKDMFNQNSRRGAGSYGGFGFGGDWRFEDDD